MDEHPPQFHQRPAALVPVCRPGHGLDLTAAAAVPGDVENLPLRGALDNLRRVGQVVPLDARTPLARVRRRRFHEVGVGVEQADQGQPLSRPRGQLGEFMGRVVAVGGDDELPIGEPSHQDANQLTEQLGRCFVPFFVFLVLLLRPIEARPKGGAPGVAWPRGRKPARPARPTYVPSETPCRSASRHRITMAALAVDMRARMFGDRVVAGQENGTTGRKWSRIKEM